MFTHSFADVAKKGTRSLWVMQMECSKMIQSFNNLPQGETSHRLYPAMEINAALS